METISISKSTTTYFHFSLLFLSLYIKNMFCFLCVFFSLQALHLQVLWQFTRHITLTVSVYFLTAIFTTLFLGQKHNHNLQCILIFKFGGCSISSMPQWVYFFPSCSIFQCKRWFATYKTKNYILLVVSLIPMYYLTKDLNLP